MKRRITLARERRDPTRAVQLLNEYLTVFMSDTEAWLELSDLYIQQGMYSNAAFCFEELLLASPQNCHLYIKYAELRFTMGGVENLELAKKNYSFALELNPDKNTNRAWFGLLATTHALALLADPASGASKKASSAASESKYVIELNKLARKQLTKNYETSGAAAPLKECLGKTLNDFAVDSVPESSSASSKGAKTR
jgi:ER membrane protein complex subunit 2